LVVSSLLAGSLVVFSFFFHDVRFHRAVIDVDWLLALAFACCLSLFDLYYLQSAEIVKERC
jgi:hypothetical protein